MFPSQSPKPCGDGKVATHVGMTGWEHAVTDLHAGGEGLILTSLVVTFEAVTLSVEPLATEQPF